VPGRSVSGYVDDKVADRLNDIARVESRSPAKIVGQALGFYVALPEAARNSLRRIEALALPDEVRWFQTEFIRLLFKVDMRLTQRQMANEVAPAIPEASTEEDLEQASLEWTNSLGR
jgi:predicted transcriptional regulator